MSNVLTKPLFKLKIHFENNATDKRKDFKTTENIGVNSYHEAMIVLSELLSKKKIKKAYYNGKQIRLPE